MWKNEEHKQQRLCTRAAFPARASGETPCFEFGAEEKKPPRPLKIPGIPRSLGCGDTHTICVTMYIIPAYVYTYAQVHMYTHTHSLSLSIHIYVCMHEKHGTIAKSYACVQKPDNGYSRARCSATERVHTHLGCQPS